MDIITTKMIHNFTIYRKYLKLINYKLVFLIFISNIFEVVVFFITSKLIIEEFNKHIDFNPYKLIFIISFLFFLRAILFIISSKFQNEYIFNIRNNFNLQNILNKNEIESQELTKKILVDTELFTLQFIQPLIYLFSELLSVICIILLLFYANTSLALISLSLLFPLLFFYVKYASNRSEKNGYERNNAELNRSILLDAILKTKKEQLLDKDIFLNLVNKFIKYTKLSSESWIKSFNQIASLRVIIETISIIVILISVSIYYYFNNNLSLLISSMIVFTLGALKLLPSISRISNYYQTIRYSLPLINDNSKSDLNEIIKNNAVNSIKSNIKEFTNFEYSEHIIVTINSKIIHLKKYVPLMIIGNSGSGKTTNLLNIVKNFENNIPHAYYLPADANVFSGSILDNILCGRENFDSEYLNYLLEEVDLAAALRNLNIRDLNNSFENSTKLLSSGQIQRLLIVRSLINKPNLLIMDEPCSALDNESAYKIIKFVTNNIPFVIYTSHNKLIQEKHEGCIFRLEFK